MRALELSTLLLTCLLGTAALAQPQFTARTDVAAQADVAAQPQSARPAPAQAAPAPAAVPYQIVVNDKNPMALVGRKFLSEAFLKKTTRWEHGELIRPVDQDADSAVRRKFSEHVLNRSVSAVRSYWQQVIFAGRNVPPPELPDDRQVLDYVRRHTGAVGYVSAAADTAGTKVLAVR